MPRLNMKQQMLDLQASDASVLLGPGIYILGYDDEIVWVGQSKRLIVRITDHVTMKGHSKGQPVFPFDSIYILPVDYADLLTVEAHLVLKFNPRYNIASPIDLYHRVRQGLIGNYSAAHKRRLSEIMGHSAMSYEYLANLDRVDWDDMG
jgi:hypothetical protein